MARDALSDGPEGASPLLELKAVAAGPPERTAPVLTGVNLSLAAGECAVLLGGNGAGKSTLLRTIAGLWPPRAGDLRSPAGGSFDPRRVGLVLEDPSAQFVAGTVAGELEFALENQALPRDAILARRDAVLEELELEPLRHRDPRTLSPGEQGRCLLAAALAPDPPLLLLDDTFLYLGPGEGRALWDRVRDAARSDRCRAVLLAAHDGELAADADRVGVLEEGRLLAWGPPAEVFAAALPSAVEPPLHLWLAAALRGRGVPVPPDVSGEEELAAWLSAEGKAR